MVLVEVGDGAVRRGPAPRRTYACHRHARSLDIICRGVGRHIVTIQDRPRQGVDGVDRFSIDCLFDAFQIAVILERACGRIDHRHRLVR